MSERTLLRDMVERARQHAYTTHAEEIAVVFGNLAPDALDVLGIIVERMREGQRRYGRLDVLTDPRDFLAEADEELDDFVVYMAMEVLRRRRRAEGKTTTIRLTGPHVTSHENWTASPPSMPTESEASS